MRILKIIVGILLLPVLFSCGKSDEERAAGKFKQAVSICEKKDTLSALQVLDSIPKLFPEAAEIIKKAKEQVRVINSDILSRKQTQLDRLNARMAELEKPFDTEKTEFDHYTQYIPKNQNFERRWNQSYIQLHLDERGELYISSNYYGPQWLDHVGIRVYDGVFQAKTDSVSLDDENNHHSDFMDTHWEKVSYKGGKDNGVIQFIAENTHRNLKAVFLGKRMYFIVLEQFDKQAIKDALTLSNALKLRRQLEKEIAILRTKMK